MFKKLISLAIFLALAYATVNAGTVYIRYQQFKDAVRETALFAGTKSDDQLKARVMELAQRDNVPLDPEYVHIERVADRVTITASYVEMIKLLPGYERQWQFDIVTR
ncbi:MAG: hypothetical protein DMF84_11145 [Acidobacteria bacterium]|nr:MAG: hypothetical protein DMF84_11145 [Acidobacteriota bacterium]